MFSSKYSYVLLILVASTSLWARNGLIVEEQMLAKLSLPFASIEYNQHFIEYTNPLHNSIDKEQTISRLAHFARLETTAEKRGEFQAKLQQHTQLNQLQHSALKAQQQTIVQQAKNTPQQGLLVAQIDNLESIHTPDNPEQTTDTPKTQPPSLSQNKPHHPASLIETRLHGKQEFLDRRTPPTQIELYTNEYPNLIQIENLLEHERKSSLENFIEENIEFEGVVLNKENSTISVENSIFGKKAFIHPIVGINFHTSRDQLEYGYVGRELLDLTLNNLFPSFGLRNLGLKMKLMPNLHLQTSYYFETSTSKFGKISEKNTVYQGFEALVAKKDNNLSYEFFLVLEATKKLDVSKATSDSFKGLGVQLRYSL